MTEKEKLEDQLAIIKAEKEVICKKIKRLGQAFRKLKEELYSADENLKRKIRAEEKIEKLILLEKPFTDLLIKKRKEIVALVTERKRKDITISRAEELDTKIKNLIADLAKECDHRLIRGFAGYGGSAYYDYDDEYNGYRECLVCNYHEWGKYYKFVRVTDEKIDEYNILQSSNNRIIDLIPRKELSDFDIWRPLPEIIQYFENKI